MKSKQQRFLVRLIRTFLGFWVVSFVFISVLSLVQPVAPWPCGQAAVLAAERAKLAGVRAMAAERPRP